MLGYQRQYSIHRKMQKVMESYVGIGNPLDCMNVENDKIINEVPEEI